MSENSLGQPLSTFIARVVGGGTPARSVHSYWVGPIPWASVKDLNDSSMVLTDTEEHISAAGLAGSASNLVPAGTPLVCTRMAVGRCALPAVDIAINQDLKALIPALGTDAKYLAHGLNYLQPALDAVATGSTVKGLPLSQLLTFRLRRPALSEQRRTAEILDTLDDQIRATEQIIAKLRRVKQGLLVALLSPGISTDQLRDLFAHQDQFVDSTAGRLPNGWTVEPLGKLLAKVDPAMRSGPFGSALLKHELVASGIPLLGIDNVHVDKFVPNYTRFVKREKASELSRYRVRPGDVMITIMGTVGRSCVVPDDIGEALSSKHVWTMTIDSNRYDPYLVSLQLNHAPWARAHLRRDEQGGIMNAIRSETLRSLPLPVPPIREQRRIAEVLQQCDDRIAREEAELGKLQPTKQGLMADLLTGRIRVPVETVA